MAASHGQGEEQTALGVISGHAYSFITAKEFMHDNKLVRLCMLRNPWGQGEWTGDWSDKSPLWTDALRKEIGCNDADDGTFHIPFEDYLDQYAWTSIAVDNDPQYKRSSTVKTFEAEDTEGYFVFDL